MPRYLYKCDQCKELTPAMHPSDEKLLDCEKCNQQGTLRKLLTRPTYIKKQKHLPKTGEVTEEFIVDAREDLRRQQEDLHKKR